MKAIGIFYGSSTGNTQNIAEQIAKKLGRKVDLFDVENVTVDQLLAYDMLFLGSSTWGTGDLQDDWEGFAGKLGEQDLSGKTIAIFGTGDSSSYSDTFCDAIGILAKTVQETGATLVGRVDPSGYTFDSSLAIQDNKFCGLPLDVENEDDLTETRLNQWIEQVKAEAKL